MVLAWLVRSIAVSLPEGLIALLLTINILQIVTLVCLVNRWLQTYFFSYANSCYCESAYTGDRGEKCPGCRPSLICKYMQIYVAMCHVSSHLLFKEKHNVRRTSLLLQIVTCIFTNILDIILNKFSFGDSISDAVNLTHCGLVTPYGDVDVGQHWLR